MLTHCHSSGGKKMCLIMRNPGRLQQRPTCITSVAFSPTQWGECTLCEAGRFARRQAVRTRGDVSCSGDPIELQSAHDKKTLGLFPRLPITQMYSVSGWMALRWLIVRQPGERFDPKWLFLLSLSFKIHSNIPFSSFFHRNWTNSSKVHWANGCEMKWIVSLYKHSVIFLSVWGDNFNLNF